MSYHLEVVPDGRWARTVAGHLEEAMIPGAKLCLASGSTTAPLYRALSDNVDFAKLYLFLLDEFGGLGRDDPGRCEAMVRRDLLGGRDGVHLSVPDVDASDRNDAAAAYGQEIRTAGIDLALVGLGLNGHIGMNEPGTERHSLTRVVRLSDTTRENARTYGVATPPEWGITLGIGELLDSKRIWLLVTGSRKAEMLSRVLTSQPTSDVPATFLKEHSDLTIWADESAAARIRQ